MQELYNMIIMLIISSYNIYIYKTGDSYCASACKL